MFLYRLAQSCLSLKSYHLLLGGFFILLRFLSIWMLPLEIAEQSAMRGHRQSLSSIVLQESSFLFSYNLIQSQSSPLLYFEKNKIIIYSTKHGIVQSFSLSLFLHISLVL